MEEVRRIRLRHPVIGGRKLHTLLQPFLHEHQIKLGRDAFFALLGEHNLLIKRKRKQTITTYSRHWLRKYPNLIKDLNIDRSNQVWVSDITYLKTKTGFVYLSLVTDAYSHRVMGYHAADSLESVHSVKALQMALTAANRPVNGLTHHSDRGVQYCSREYVKLLQDNHIKISMTENGDPLENPIAERINGIIKNEYLFEHKVQDRKHAEQVLQNAVNLYNQERPHYSLGMLTPNIVFKNNFPVQKLWKNYYFNTRVSTKKQTVNL